MKSTGQHKLFGVVCAVAVVLQLGVLTGSAQTGEYLYTGSITTITLAPGTYDITAYGAQGGNGSFASGGLGAEMEGEFNFTAAVTLTILVGGGGHGPGYYSGGGGGGSFVVNGATALVVAGGGGGGGYSGNGAGAFFTGGGGKSFLNGGAGGGGNGWGSGYGDGGYGGGGGGYNGGGGGGGYSGGGGGRLPEPQLQRRERWWFHH